MNFPFFRPITQHDSVITWAESLLYFVDLSTMNSVSPQFGEFWAFAPTSVPRSGSPWRILGWSSLEIIQKDRNKQKRMVTTLTKVSFFEKQWIIATKHPASFDHGQIGSYPWLEVEDSSSAGSRSPRSPGSFKVPWCHFLKNCEAAATLLQKGGCQKWCCLLLLLLCSKDLCEVIQEGFGRSCFQVGAHMCASSIKTPHQHARTPTCSPTMCHHYSDHEVPQLR